MKGGIRYSTLNPLATCFVPLNPKNPVLQDTEVSIAKDATKMSPKSSLIMKFRPKLRFKNGTKKIDIIMDSSALSAILDLTQHVVKLLNEDFYFTEKAVRSESFKSILPSSFQSTAVDGAALLKYLFLNLLSISPKKESSKKAKIDPVEFQENKRDYEVESKVEKCSCPPMFGCIIPPNFFGNPFNLKPYCSKKNAHVCHYSETSGNLTPESGSEEDRFKSSSRENLLGSNNGIHIHDINENNIPISKNAERYLPSKCSDGTCNISFCKDLKTEEQSNDSGFFNFDNEGPIDDYTLIDDGNHPLLDEGICMEADEGVFNEVNDSLATKLHKGPTSPRLSFDPEELAETSSCNPPCSIWCDSLPQSAREAYTKYIRSSPRSEDLWSCSKPKPTERLAFNHQVYSERSLLTRSLGQKKNFQCRLEPNRILARPKVSEPFNQIREYTLISMKNVPVQAAVPTGGGGSKGRGKNMWGVFDGANSLWQAMPECSPLLKTRL